MNDIDRRDFLACTGMTLFGLSLPAVQAAIAKGTPLIAGFAERFLARRRSRVATALI